MADKLISEGICALSGKTYKKAGINRHLTVSYKKSIKS